MKGHTSASPPSSSPLPNSFGHLAPQKCYNKVKCSLEYPEHRNTTCDRSLCLLDGPGTILLDHSTEVKCKQNAVNATVSWWQVYLANSIGAQKQWDKPLLRENGEGEERLETNRLQQLDACLCACSVPVYLVSCRRLPSRRDEGTTKSFPILSFNMWQYRVLLAVLDLCSQLFWAWVLWEIIHPAWGTVPVEFPLVAVFFQLYWATISSI